MISRQDGLTRVQPQLPVEGSRQRFIYEDADEGTWQVQIVEFCIVKEGCPNDVGIWMEQELLEGAKRAVLAAVLIFVGGWFVGLGLRRGWLVWRQPDLAT